jgi:hypothetical protein
MHVIAHEPAFNDYSSGILCYYHTICEGIVRGGKRFHLLSGRYEYKYRLLGATVEIDASIFTGAEPRRFFIVEGSPTLFSGIMQGVQSCGSLSRSGAVIVQRASSLE